MNNQYGGNQFGFNDPNQYNQYNQQPVDPNMQQQMYNQQMYNQQPMMDPYQNQYPNQYNPYMYNQPPRRGGGFGILGILIALILLAGLVLFLLDYTGTVDVKGWFVK